MVVGVFINNARILVVVVIVVVVVVGKIEMIYLGES